MENASETVSAIFNDAMTFMIEVEGSVGSTNTNIRTSIQAGLTCVTIIVLQLYPPP